MIRLGFLVIAATILFSSAAFSEEYRVGDLVIGQTVARATAPGQKVGGGYAVIFNKGTEADRLIGATADFAGMVEIHEMKMQGDVMMMSPLPDGLEIAPGTTIQLRPGGYHIMFMALKEALKKGEERKATLVFEKAGEVEVTFKVLSIAETLEMFSEGMKMDSSGEKDDAGEEKSD